MPNMTISVTSFLAAAVAGAVAGTVSAGAVAPSQIEGFVETAFGPIQGNVFDRAVGFLGVPYAAAPVGELRWQPPQQAPTWGPSILQALYGPPGCMQSCEEPPHVCPTYISEDCLYLNVWTPRLATITEPLPVVMWMHGGSFKDGFAGGVDSGLVYNGQDMVNNTNVILVTINYRLGIFGFLYAGDATNIQGNYGLMDQEYAMRWIKNNIAAFGGDPNDITITGQSAGAMSVSSHLSRPWATEGLFQKAIMHSNPFGLPYRDPLSGINLAIDAAHRANCTKSLLPSKTEWSHIQDCMRNLTSASLLDVQMSVIHDPLADLFQLMQVFVAFTPTVGTDYLPLHPRDAFQAGRIADVPIIQGTVLNEGNIFIYGAFKKPVGQAEVKLLVPVLLGKERAAMIWEQYPFPNPLPTDYRSWLADVATDALFRCPNRNVTTSVVSTAGRQSSSFLYEYRHAMSFNPALWGTGWPFRMCWDVVCHGDDLANLFHPYYPQYGTNYTQPEDVLSRSTQTYWTNLAKTGAPGPGFVGAPLEWPAFNAEERPYMILDLAKTTTNDPYGAKCDHWDQVGYVYY